MQDVERQSLWQHLGVDGLLDGDFEDVSLDDLGLWIGYDLTGTPDRAVGQKAREPRPGQMRLLWHIARKRLIKTRRRLGADNDGDKSLWHERGRRLST